MTGWEMLAWAVGSVCCGVPTGLASGWAWLSWYFSRTDL